VAAPLSLLELVYAHSPAALQVFASDGHCVLTNPAFRRLFGSVPPPEYNVLADQLIAETGYLELIHRAFAGETVSVPPVWYDARCNGQVPVDNGRRVGVAATFFPLRDEYGRVAHVAALFEDLTQSMAQREAAETARAEAERSERRALFLSHAGKLLASSLDPEATLELVARLAVPELADFCLVDLVDDTGQMKKRAAVHVDPEAAPILDELRRRYPPFVGSRAPAALALSTGEPHHLPEVGPAELARFTVDAGHFELMMRLGVRSHLAVPLSARGRTLGAISLGYSRSGRRYQRVDVRIAEELAARAALALDNARLYAEADAARRSAELDRVRLQALVAQAPAYVFILRGPQHRLELCNKAGERLFDPKRTETLGRPVVELLPKPVRCHLPLWDRVYQTGEPLEARELMAPVVADDGSVEERCFNFVLQPLRGPEGRIDGVMSFAFDVSGEVQARRRIDAALHDAEAANRAKDEFLAMLGHELRNPLAPIATAVQLMQLHPRGDRRRELEVIDRQVKHVIRLVDDLLDVSRITRGKVQLNKVRVEASRLVANAVEMASPLLEQRRHQLAVEVPRSGLPLDADDARLAQVLANLLTNAAKYTEPGGHIAVTAACEGAEVVIRVRDNGRGIAAEMLPRIFDLFVQGQRSPDRAEGGLGLGLALVRNLVELHGGSVAARSEGPGCGSEFVVRLPRAPVQERALDDDKELTAAGGLQAQKRVLLVDDNQDAAELLGEVLRSAGHEVAIAHDGPEALGLLRRFHPEVAVLDIGLPVMDGYELARRLRKEPELDRLRCIAVTGYGQETDRARSRQAGFELHLVKPVDLSALLQALQH
jgi:signal transduction histidine kinase